MHSFYNSIDEIASPRRVTDGSSGSAACPVPWVLSSSERPAQFCAAYTAPWDLPNSVRPAQFHAACQALCGLPSEACSDLCCCWGGCCGYSGRGSHNNRCWVAVVATVAGAATAVAVRWVIRLSIN